MDLFQAIVLGVIQGLTEFLPVSSSGHLVLFQNLFGLTEPELLFDIAVHVGTLLAVCAVFYKDIGAILSSIWGLPGLIREQGGLRSVYRHQAAFHIAVLIVIGSVPTALIGLLFSRFVDRIFGSVWIVGVMLLITGTVLWLTRRTKNTERSTIRVRWTDALIIGVVQGLAILPGISRSGSTIAVALFLGIDRETAGKFSFLLSIPAIVGALILELNSGIQWTGSMITLISGAALATLVGYGALVLLMRFVKRGRLYQFSPYCWLLGLSALAWTMFA